MRRSPLNVCIFPGDSPHRPKSLARDCHWRAAQQRQEPITASRASQRLVDRLSFVGPRGGLRREHFWNWAGSEKIDTMLGLRAVSSEIVEFGRMAGCSKRQLLWKVQIPLARATLMLGIL